MRRSLLNLAALTVVVGGSTLLSKPAQADTLFAETCKAGNGATCTGNNCCADATQCWATCPPPSET